MKKALFLIAFVAIAGFAAMAQEVVASTDGFDVEGIVLTDDQAGNVKGGYEDPEIDPIYYELRDYAGNIIGTREITDIRIYRTREDGSQRVTFFFYDHYYWHQLDTLN